MEESSHRSRWNELDKLLDELLDMPDDARDQRLSALAETDRELHDAVLRLLAADENSSPILDGGAQAFSDGALAGIAENLRRHDRLTNPDPDADGSGRRLGRYRLLKRLGSGGMGDVWIAERADEIIQQTVAIKILHPLVGADAISRFEQERHILASLQHDGIARILDAGASSGEPPYLVLEYVDGVPVTDYCRSRKLKRSERLQLFAQVCNAVAHAHRRLVVHRDLKPANILVDKKGNVKLLDFGIAKLLDQSRLADDGAVTREGWVPMTPEYASPEQIRGENITTATDVYGLGLLLFELLSGARPFKTAGLTPLELERLICTTEPLKPSQASVQRRSTDSGPQQAVPRDLDTIVLKALQKNPDDRYSSVDELSADIDNFVEGRPVHARSPSLAYRTGKFLRRNGLALITLSALLVTVGVGIGSTMWQAREAQLQKARFESTGEFLFALFEQVDPDLHPGSQITAAGLLDIGATQLEKFAAGPEARVDLLRVLGVLYQKLGEREHGETLLRQAVAEATANLDSDNNTIGQAMNSLGVILVDRGQLQEAEQVLLRSKAAFDSAGEIGRWPLGVDYDLARALYMQGRWQEALSTLSINVDSYDEFLVDDPRSLVHRTYCTALTFLGELQTDLDKWEDARATLTQSIEIAATVMGENHPAHARALQSMASLDYRIGNYQAAEDYLRKAVSIRRSAHPGGHQSIALMNAQLSEMLYLQEEFDESRTLLEEANAIWASLPEGSYAERADQFGALAKLHIARGEIEEAREQQTVAVFVRRLAHASIDHWRVANELHRLGRVEMLAGNFAEAENHLTQALQIRVAAFTEQHSSAAESQASLGELYLHQQRQAEAREFFGRALTTQTAVLPAAHPATATTRLQLERLQQGLQGR